MKTTADIIIRLRWFIIFAFIAITAIFAVQLPQAEIDSDMLNQLPADVPSKVHTEKIEELFGGTEMLMVLIKTDDVLNRETLEQVKRISKGMKKIRGVDKVLSLFDLKHIKGEDGAMIIDPAVKRIPRTEEQREKLRKEIISNDIVYGSVVSKDFAVTAAIAILQLNVSDEYIVGEVEKLISEDPGKAEMVIGGVPHTRLQVSQNTKGDISRLLPIGLVIMLIFLYFCFRQLRGVILPFLVVIMSILVAMGAIPLFGWKISTLSILLPVFLIAVANDYGIHMIANYQEDNVPGHAYSKSELAKRMFNHLGKPVLLTGLTTMTGMLCLLGHVLIGARQVGILAAIGIVYALAASLFFIPAVVSFLPIPKPVAMADGNGGKKPFLERLLSFFGDFVSRRPKAVIAGALIFSSIASVGIFFIEVDADPTNYYEKHHPVVYVTDIISEHLGGAFNISIAFEGDIKTPEAMQKIDQLEGKIRNIPEIGYTVSIARVVRQMSRALNDEGEEWYDRIPDTRNGVAQYLELYSMSGDSEDLEKMVDFPYEHALLTARVNTTSTPRLNSALAQIKEMIKDDQQVKYIGGIALIFSDMARQVVNGQFLSLCMAIVAVTILLIILFRSVAAGAISAIPLALSMAILFGLMGLLNIELNMATALLSSIMIGVGIDYTIHFLWRYREERQNGLAPQEAVCKTLTTTGRGIIFNAFSVIVGFVALTVSSFVPVRFFGFLVIVSISACLIGALILVPSLCIVLRPRFS